MSNDWGREEDPLVSVVLPTYDRPESLKEAFRSVKKQTYPRIELVVVDDCSPVPAAESIDEVGTDGISTVRCVRHDDNQGANAARNTGIRRSTGELVAFLDDDDRWMPEKVTRQVRRFEDGPADLGVVTVGTRIVDSDGTWIGTSRASVEGDAFESLLYGAVVGSFSRIMVRSEAISQAGLLDESFPSWQDREWCLRLSRHCTFASVSDILVERRIDSDDRISDDFEQKRDVSYPRFLEKHRSLAAEQGTLVERRFVASLSRTLAFSGLSHGYYRDAIKYLSISLVYYPFDPKSYVYLGLALCGPLTFKPARRLKRKFSGGADVEPP